MNGNLNPIAAVGLIVIDHDW